MGCIPVHRHGDWAARLPGEEVDKPAGRTESAAEGWRPAPGAQGEGGPVPHLGSSWTTVFWAKLRKAAQKFMHTEGFQPSRSFWRWPRGRQRQ